MSTLVLKSYSLCEIYGMKLHYIVSKNCSPSSKWVPGGNTGEVKGGEERNWPPYLTMPATQYKCPSNGHSPNVRDRTWDSSLLLFQKSMYGLDISNLNAFDIGIMHWHCI